MLNKDIDDFINSLRSKNASPLTIRNYKHYLHRFLSFASKKHAPKITADLVDAYHQYLSDFVDPLSKSCLKNATINYHLIALRALVKYLNSKHALTLEASRIRLSKQPLAKPQYLRMPQIEAILKAPDINNVSGLRDRVILEVLFATGLLVSELASLNRKDFNRRTNFLKVVGKRSKEKEIGLSSRAAYWLEKYLQQRSDAYTPLFIRFQGIIDLTDNGEYMRLTARSIERIVAKYAKACGLPIQVTPHTLRHSKALEMINQGKSLEVVKKTLDHAKLASVENLYTK